MASARGAAPLLADGRGERPPWSPAPSAFNDATERQKRVCRSDAHQRLARGRFLAESGTRGLVGGNGGVTAIGGAGRRVLA